MSHSNNRQTSLPSEETLIRCHTPLDEEKDEALQTDALIELFDALYSARYNTRLVRGEDEPIYLPADETTPYHRIVFAHGFFASALHEISHWCIAGPRRRLLEDFGYWYLPDGRNQNEQEAFEKAEIAPQAIELILTQACGRHFNVSVDNLSPDIEVDREAFRTRVEQKAKERLQRGLPPRIEALRRALTAHFKEGTSHAVACQHADEIFIRYGTPA